MSIEGNAARSDKTGWIALIVGTGIISWSGVLARFLDVGPPSRGSRSST